MENPRAITFTTMKFLTFSTYNSLAKTKLSLMLTVSALAGNIIAGQGTLSQTTLLVGLAVFALASAAAIINNIQDRNIDRLMGRTRTRPLAKGAVTVSQAAILAGLHLLLAILFLYPLSVTSHAPAIYAFLAIVLYNGIYTPLKPRTIWAIVPGSICGALPPLIGWYATTGNGPTQQIILFAMIIWIWQFPHFWLKMLSFSGDYLGKDTMLGQYSHKQMDMFIAVWTISFAILTLVSPLYGLVYSTIGLCLLLALALMIVVVTWLSLFAHKAERRYQQMFISLNYALFLFMSISVADQFLGASPVFRF